MGDELLTLATTGGRLWCAVRQPIAAFLARGASLYSLGTDFERTMERLGGKAEYHVGRWKIDFGIGQVDLPVARRKP